MLPQDHPYAPLVNRVLAHFASLDRPGRYSDAFVACERDGGGASWALFFLVATGRAEAEGGGADREYTVTNQRALTREDWVLYCADVLRRTQDGPGADEKAAARIAKKAEEGAEIDSLGTLPF